ncbi:MAG: DUF2490 domain-containing protein [Bacteroidota bacterium]|nr:DUF2490 domain-containing protein [Bacteroidota bacterium]
MRRILISIFLIFPLFFLSAQENDLQSWHSFSLKNKINKTTDINLKVGARFRENSSLLDKNFLEVRLKKELNKRTSISTGYRNTFNYDTEFVLVKQNRFYFDLIYKNKLTKRLSYSIRNRWQNQVSIYQSARTFRQKFSLEYNIRKTKLTPYCAVEYFSNSFDHINKLRSTISLSYPISKDIDVDFAYRMQNEFWVNNPQTIFIFETKISYSL